MCKGAVAMGADALLIEVHPNPAEAWSDGAQQLSLDMFAELMQELKPFIAAAGREQALCREKAQKAQNFNHGLSRRSRRRRNGH
jgi:hypothetical protein